MPENKTKPTGASVADYIASRGKGSQLEDSESLITMMRNATGEDPYMWGASIVGFGTYKYRYASGHGGEAPLSGFAIRGRELVVYLTCHDDRDAELLAKLGPHRVSKACLYLKKLADVDTKVLEKLIRNSVRQTRKLHPETS